MQAAAHVFQRHAVAAFAHTTRKRVAYKHTHHIAPHCGANQHICAIRARLHPVANGIFKQGLQNQCGHARQAGGRIGFPTYAQAIAKAHFFNFQIAFGQLQLIAQGTGMAHVLQHLAKQITQVFKHRFGSRRIRAHQRNGAIERVEQKMGANARLQFGQLRLHITRRLQLPAQHQQRHQHRSQKAASQHAPCPNIPRHIPHAGQQSARKQAAPHTQHNAPQPLRQPRLARQPLLGDTHQHQPQQGSGLCAGQP